VVDANLRSKLIENGYSRIPVYERTKQNIVGLLFLKDIVLLDVDLELKVRTVLLTFGLRNFPSVFFDVKLDEMLREFKRFKSHIAIVKLVHAKNPNSEPFSENIGIITLEDVLESVLQQEIFDEKDIDNLCRPNPAYPTKRIWFSDEPKSNKLFSKQKFTYASTVLSPSQISSSEVSSFDTSKMLDTSKHSPITSPLHDHSLTNHGGSPKNSTETDNRTFIVPSPVIGLARHFGRKKEKEEKQKETEKKRIFESEEEENQLLISVHHENVDEAILTTNEHIPSYSTFSRFVQIE